MNRIRIADSGLVKLSGLATLVVLSTSGCLSNPTITPNAHSELVGPDQAKTDESECFQHGMAEKRRLLNELMAGDPKVVANENREAGAEGTARDMAKMEGATSAEAALAAGVAGFIFSSWDSDTYDESNLAKYLGIEGGLGAGFTATKRLQYMCLRSKGYDVDDHAKDGGGTAHLVWGKEGDPITRVVIRDGSSERVFYEYVP